MYESLDHRPRKLLTKLHLYHPSIHHLIQLSKGTNQPLQKRSDEFARLMKYVMIDGVSKRTAPGRLSDLDAWVIPYFVSLTEGAYEILDVGASDGITTLDMVRAFESSFGTRVRATILERNLYVRAFKRFGLQYYVIQNNDPWLLQLGPVGFLLEETKEHNVIDTIYNQSIRQLREWIRGIKLQDKLTKSPALVLANPLVASCPTIDWLEQDVFALNQSLVNRYSFVRCSNLLNPDYFSKEKIHAAIGLLAQYLKRNGLLMISRTDDSSKDGKNMASLWIRKEERLEYLSDYNGGVEVKSLVSN